MIIGINGKIGSGKDTIGKIIQYLKCHYTGDKTIEKVLSGSDDDWWLEEQSGWEVKKFAGKLKTIASLLTGIPVEKFEDQEFKKLDMNSEWGMTYREFLQKLGTEAMREGLHRNVWVNALFADYKMWSDGRKDWYPDWIITDLRFPNEMEAVKERGGITIRVSRTGIHTPKIEDLHPSETALDDCEFDYHIDNSGTIADLVKKVREILIDERII